MKIEDEDQDLDRKINPEQLNRIWFDGFCLIICQSDNFEKCLANIKTILSEPKLKDRLLLRVFRKALWFADDFEKLDQLLMLAKEEENLCLIDLVNQKVSQIPIIPEENLRQ